MKKYILDFNSLNEMKDGVLGNLHTIFLSVIGSPEILSDKVFQKLLKQSLKRSTHYVKLLSETHNKLYFKLLIDANSYHIITDLLNDLKRELELGIGKHKAKHIEIEEKENNVILKLK